VNAEGLFEDNLVPIPGVLKSQSVWAPSVRPAAAHCPCHGLGLILGIRSLVKVRNGGTSGWLGTTNASGLDD
jgi:hypothetical protein